MRAFVIFWVMPLLAFWSWLFLAQFDAGPGLFSRHVYDTTFQLYGRLLGMDPDAIPRLIAEAILLDSLIILAILAFRRRKTIRAWFEAQRRRGRDGVSETQVFGAKDPVSASAATLPPVFGHRTSPVGEPGPQ